MLSLNMTAGDDNALLFVYEIILDTSSIKASSRAITLSSNLWSGGLLSYGSLSDIQQGLDISSGGNVSSVGNFSIGIANNTGTFIDDFYPTTSEPYLYGRTIRVGVVWSTATLETQITWLTIGIITDVQYNPAGITITCMEAKEIESKYLPPYETQNVFDNGISYFTVIPDYNLGLSIPVIYGDLTTWEGFEDRYILAPAILVDKSNLTWICACHKLHTESKSGSDYYIYTLNDDLGDIIKWENTAVGTTSGTNNYGYSDLVMQATFGGITGTVYIRFEEIGEVTTESNSTAEVLNSDFTDYSVLQSTKIFGFRTGGSTTRDRFGSIVGVSASIAIRFLMSSDDANSRSVEINYQKPDGTNGAGTTVTVTGTTLGVHEWSATAAAEIDELLSYQYWVQNDDPNAGDDVRVANGYLYLSGFLWVGLARASKYKRSERDSNGEDLR